MHHVPTSQGPRALLAIVLSAALVLLGAPPASAQDIEFTEDNYFSIQFDEMEGEKLEDFIDLARNILHQPIKYNPAEVGDVRIRILGPQRVHPDDFYKYFQAVLKAYEFIVVNYGPEGSSFLSIQRVTAGGPRGGGFSAARSGAPVVPVERLDEFRDNPATLVTTSIPLKYIPARETMSTFSTMFDQQLEQVRNVENSNSLVITAFGSNVWYAYQLIQLIDVPPFKPQPTIRNRELKHASVEEVETVLNDLLAASRGLRPGQTAQNAQAVTGGTAELEPRIIPEPRGNSFLIAGDDDMVERIDRWIDVLDVEVEPRGNIHVYRLKNMRAGELVETLQRVLEEEQQASQAGRGSGAGSAAGVTATSGLEIQASVVADPASNSVIITASDRKYAELVDIIRELDVRRPQVLIEAAIVETGRTINEALDVGVAFGDFDDGAFVSNFGTTLGFTDDGTIDLPASVQGAGGNFAIFSGSDFPIPVIIQALETDVRNRVLSRPSLLTNDNQEAFIQTQQETAYRTSTVLQSGAQDFDFETVEAGILLRISPTISAGNYLSLHVRIEVSNFQDPSSGLEGAPPDVIRREIETPVTLPDGHTVVLGGLVSNENSDNRSGIPWLSDLPIIGFLFQSTSERVTDRYLYVFITPHIIDTDFALLDEISEARKLDYERLGGNVSQLTAAYGVAGTDADLRPLDSRIDTAFDMPSAAIPTSGASVEQVSPAALDVIDPRPFVPPAAPPQQNNSPSFDDVFGFGGDGGG